MSTMTNSPSVILIVFVAPAILICVVIFVMLGMILSRKYPVCCCFTPHRTEKSVADSLHYPSRHSYDGHSAATAQGAAGSQLPGGLFFMGKPDHYHLSAAPPRLPSYDSVRKQDRQRQVHAMISRRFGLGGGHEEPPPPSYDENLHSSLDFLSAHLHSGDAQAAAQTQGTIQNINVGTQNQNQNQPATGSWLVLSSGRTGHSSSFLYN